MPAMMRRISRTERPFDVATACSLTASLSSDYSFAPVSVGGMDDVFISVGSPFAVPRYRWDEDIVVVVMMLVSVVRAGKVRYGLGWDAQGRGFDCVPGQAISY